MDLHQATDREFTDKLTEIVLANLGDEKFGPEELVLQAGTGYSYLRKRLKSTTKKTISRFISDIRLQEAYKMLQSGKFTVSEVSWKVGFASPAYFTKCFHEQYGFAPGEIKTRGNKNQDKNGDSIEFKTVSIPDQTKIRSRRKKKFRIFSVIFFVIISLGIIMMLSYRKFIASQGSSISRLEKSIAVLPFKNLSDNKENQYFADGVMEDILTNLSYIREFKVISRTSAEEFRETRLNIHEISKKLGVNYILEGSVQRYGEKVRVRVQFINARRDQHLFSETFDRDLTDIFIIQSEIAKKIAGQLQSTLSAREMERISKIPTKNIEAYKLYQMGRFFWNMRIKEDQLKSIEYFEKALKADPGFALAYAGLADAYFILAWYQWYPKIEGFSEAKKLALKALELDNTLAEAYATLGALLSWSEWKWEESRKKLMLAIELNPNCATGHQYYSELLDIIGDRNGARACINRACDLDPYSYAPNVLNARYYFNEGKLEESMTAYTNTLEIVPEKFYINWFLFVICFKRNDELKAKEYFKNYLAQDSISNITGTNTEEVFNHSGLKGLIKLSADLEMKRNPQNPYTLACRYAVLGDVEKTLTWLEKAFEERQPEIPRINSYLIFKDLRSEPRFKALIKKMGLEEYKRQ